MPEEVVAEEARPAHPDDETLNAVLDGEAAPAEAFHAHACSQCSIRLERFRRVAMDVGAPIKSVAIERRREAVTAALRAGAEPGAAVARAAAPGAPTGGQAAPHGEDVVVLAERRRRGQRLGWIVAAASVAVLAGAVSLLDLIPGGRSSEDRATSLTEQTSGAGGSVADDCGACGAVPAPAPTDGGDLGTLDREDLDALAQRLARDISQPRTSTESGRATVDQSAQPYAAPDGPAKQAARGEAELPPLPAPGPAAEESLDRCEAAARERDRNLGPLAYRAQARLDGVDAVVLGFGPAAADAPSRPTVVLVFAVGGCAELASASA